jgi:hypothetical protein
MMKFDESVTKFVTNLGFTRRVCAPPIFKTKEKRQKTKEDQGYPDTYFCLRQECTRLNHPGYVPIKDIVLQTINRD